MVRIISISFVAQRKELFKPDDLDSVEVASAFLLIWRWSSGGELSSISKFFLPVHLVPVDDENMVAVEASASVSAMVFHSPPPPSLNSLNGKHLELFVEGLKNATLFLRKAFFKPFKASVAGLVGGDMLLELVGRLNSVEQWEVRPAEIIPEKISLKEAANLVSSLNVLTKVNLERLAEVFKENLAFIDEALNSFRSEVKRLEDAAEKEKEELRRKAQEELKAEKRRLEEEIRRINSLNFTEEPPSVSTLQPYVKKLEGAFSAVTSERETEKVLTRISEAIDVLKETVKVFSRVEKEFLRYLDRKERFERDKDSLKQRAEKEFRNKEKRIFEEMERESSKISSEASQMRKLLSTAVKLRNAYNEAFKRWLNHAKNHVEANKTFLAPIPALPNFPATLHVPFFAFKTVGDEDKVTIVPPAVVDASGVTPSPPLKSLIDACLGKEEMSFVSSGLKKFNYLLNLEVATLFSKGINIMRETGVLRKREAERLKDFYDQFLRPAF